jgi:hypothetical protein
MNRKMNLMPALLAAFAGMVMLAACGAAGAKALIGTWEGDYGLTWSFTGNKFTWKREGEKDTGLYKVKGNSIFFMIGEEEEDAYEMEFEIDGDTLILKEIETYKRIASTTGATGAKALIGTWEGDYGITWSFTGNKFTQDMMGVKQTVPYKVKGNAISTKYEGSEVEMEFEIDGDTLTVEVMGFDMEFERVK